MGSDGDELTTHDLVGPLVEGFGIAAHLGFGVEIGADGAEQIPIRDDPHQLLLFQHQQMAKVCLLEDIPDDSESIIH